MMKTTHEFFQSDSRDLTDIEENSVDLVVTSPPYPMIEMWDDLFSELNEEIKESIEQENGERAYQLMHGELNKVWEEVDRVTTEGAIICINIGDATRKIGGDFRLYSNHTQITQKFEEMGYSNIPNILWKKPTNSAAKFMGSGMLPTNAYVTLEHENILLFRKPGTRKFTESEKQRRYESAYFYEERNRWFSDSWTDIRGVSQELSGVQNRDRSAAFPIEIPLRIIQMYSIQGDTVLDPFTGTGTTNLASALTARNSIGVDIDESILKISKNRLDRIKTTSKEFVRNRLKNHKKYEKDQGGLNYESENFNFTVTTKQEKQIAPKIITNVTKKGNTVKITHRDFTKEDMKT